ncbi:hypothetical protein TTHERM_01082970 (macronuclear) [Tetrahymena thermophila SB210]|uniref:Zinc carboxypeptidase family protein n=1 Tax=Tetrahymena thermophila (strain SB210) TaxID=312017 RepID=Q22BX1_TETTS|nr:hypothetical protein TTHERM_01082970 [Tetrahymena thermophila SB210]EAR82787.1 hypothetical protein TTHERM_01082970 [Tetrahymena thermophila SB210]|eukprot:XP_001030450.1 hypothetical protein TTHERM_01082970 [Tetrahymena thermophila SB210]
MDISTFSQNQTCVKHKKNQITFLKVNETLNQDSSKIFYCNECVNQDLEFKGINHILISQIIEESQTSIIQKWPPINDYTILDKLNKQISNYDSSQSILQQINHFFTELKDEIIRRIDFCQKKAINQILDLPFGTDQILKKYQEISQIEKLKKLIQSDYTDSVQKQEMECRSFIQQVESQKQTNTEQLQNLLDQCIQKEQLACFDKSNAIKLSIYQLIDSINFFPNSSQNCTNDNNGGNLSMQRLTNPEKLMQLVSNKSNFCTQEFLESLRRSLEKINPSLETVCFDKIFQENKQPIKFDGINNSKLEEIDEYVTHLTQLQNKQGYNSAIIQSERIKKILQIFESKTNFVNESMQTYIKEIMIEFYPLMKKLDTLSVFRQQEDFDLLKDLSDEVLQDFIKILRKKQQLQVNNNNTVSVSDQIKLLPFTYNFQFCKTDLDKILSNLPVFDIVSRSKTTDILQEFDMESANYNDGNQRIQIVKDNQFYQEIFVDQQQYTGSFKDKGTNCISRNVLDKELKYIFRVQLLVSDNKKHAFSIGLIQKSKLNVEAGFKQKLSCDFRYDNTNIEHKIGDGIDKYIKGDIINKYYPNFTVEIRIHLAGKILQVLDYPNYQHQIELNDEYKDKLIQFNDLCLYFHLEGENTKYILKQVQIIDEFVN